MNRTSILNEFKQQISNINDHFHHYLFVWQQFKMDNKIKLESKGEELTTLIYPDNVNSQSYNVKLSHLDETSNNAYNFILKSIFLVGYTYFENYFREVYQLCRKLNKALPEIQRNDSLPDKVFEYLSIENLFTASEKDTFSYLRLRRNRLVHTSGISKGEIKDLIRNKGHNLNKYWNKILTARKKRVVEINFQNQDIDVFEKQELFDILLIYRYLSIRSDQLILNLFDKTVVINYLENEFRTKYQKKLKNNKRDRLKIKFTSFCKNELNINISSQEASSITFW